MKKKLILGFLTVAALGIIGVWYFIFYRPTHNKRDVADEKGITITAAALVKAYQENEANANAQYLDKAVEITGEVSGVTTDAAGKPSITLKSEDEFSSVSCTLKQNTPGIETGKTITIKGVCTGFLSDVVVIDAIVTKQ
jgi:tRNA_anti-like